MTEADLDKQCGFLKDSDECLRNYTANCNTPLQEDLIDMFRENSPRYIKEYCTRGSPLREANKKYATCVRDATRDGGHKTCIKDMQVGFEVITTVEWQDRLSAACCTYDRTKMCMEKLIEEKCGSDAVDFMRTQLRQALSRMPEIMCNDYKSDSESCKSLLPPPGSELKNSKSKSVLTRLFGAATGL